MALWLLFSARFSLYDRHAAVRGAWRKVRMQTGICLGEGGFIRYEVSKPVAPGVDLRCAALATAAGSSH